MEDIMRRKVEAGWIAERATLTDLFFGKDAEAKAHAQERKAREAHEKLLKEETIVSWILRTAKAIRPSDAESYAALFQQAGCENVCDLPSIVGTFDDQIGPQIPKIIHRRLIKG